jgi:nitrate reductase gamma subunit
VLLVVLAVLVLAVPFAVLSWAFGGTTGLLAFVAPLVGLLALAGAVGWLVRRSVDQDVTR